MADSAYKIIKLDRQIHTLSMATPPEKTMVDPTMACNNPKPQLDITTDEISSTKYWGWKSMPYVIGNETFEKLGTLGSSSNLIVYLTTIFHMESVAAATLLNVWQGTTNLATLLGAFLSDAYLGRYWTLGFASIASFIGMSMLAMTAGIKSLHPREGQKSGATVGQMGFLLCALFFLVIGAGGIRPCNLAFGADQFDPWTEEGKKGINSFFNWYFFTFTIAMMVSSTFIIYVQSSVSWTIGLAIPAGLMFLSCSFFFLGTRMYVRVKPQGSPFTSFAQVFVATTRKWWWQRTGRACYGGSLYNYHDPPLLSREKSKLSRTAQFRILDKAAAIQGEEDATRENPWIVCSIQQVEEVKCILRVIPIWIACIIYFTANNQLNIFLVFQALQSDRRLVSGQHFLIPAGSFVVFNMLALTLWLPVHDRLVVPFLHRHVTGKESGISLLQRIGFGIFLSILSIVVAGIVEQRRKWVALHHPTLGTAPSGGDVSAMSSMWLVPPLVIAGLSEAFSVVGQVEFYYKQFPEDMRSVAGSFMFSGIAIASYLSGLLVSVVHRVTGPKDRNWLAGDLNRGRLDYFYYMVAAFEVLDLAYFLICARWYRYKGGGGGGNGGNGTAMGDLTGANGGDRIGTT